MGLLRRNQYDAIVSDYQMPGMDGIEFLKKVRASGDTVPFIIFTGKGREEIVVEALNAGVDFYIQKGGEAKAQFTELAHKIRQAVQQRKTEKQIRDLEHRETDMVNSLPDPTFAIDTFGHVIVWNRAMEEVSGVPAAQILGKDNHEHSMPFYGTRRPMLIDLILEPTEKIEKTYANIVRGENVLVADTNLARPKGKPLTLMGKASLLFNQRGQVVGAIESIRDITERDKAEEERRKSEERFRNVVENQTEFISRFRPDGTHVFVNSAYCRYFNKKREELTGKRFIPIIPREDKAVVRQSFASLTRDHPVAAVAHRIILPSGEIRWQQWSDRAIFDAEGHVTEYQSVGRDITQLKQAEEELKESEEKFRDIFNNINDAIQIVNLDENGDPIRFLDVNDVMCRMLQYSRDELLQKSPWDLDTGDTSKPRDQIEKELKTMGSSTFETMRITKNGVFIPVEINVHVVALRGKRIGIAVVRDITDRKAAGHSLEIANKKLNLLMDVTRHDILNQLLALHGYFDLAKSQNGNPTVEDYLIRCEASVRTIWTQLSFTRYYQNIGVKMPEWQSISGLISKVRQAFLLTNVTINDSCTDLEVFTDPLLEKVFYNLIDNALKYGGNCLSEISFTCLKNAADDSLTIICEDDGVGVSLEDKPRLFDRGYGRNTGLGLFLAREILSITDITITETGESGRGARFEITVPKGIYRFTKPSLNCISITVDGLSPKL